MSQENTILKSASVAVSADYDALVAQMAQLREELAKLAHNIQSAASTRGHAMAKDMSDGMAEAATYIGRKGHDADMRIEGAVAANPYLALGLAAGMGVLLGALTRR